MSTAEETSTEKLRTGKPFALWVMFGGLLYFGLALLALIVSLLVQDLTLFFILLSDPFILIPLVFVALFVLGAFASLTGKRWAFVLAAVVSIVFIIFFLPLLVNRLSNPAAGDFWLAISGLPALILVAIFSILALANAKGGLARKRYLATPESWGGLLTVAVVGFVIGGLIVGNIAATSITRILGGAAEAADIRIVLGAENPQTEVPFDPATLTVAVGDTVTWYNADIAVHTVTSDTGLFDSGDLAPGDTWSYTFAEAGTYTYHCIPHAFMKGTVVVS